ncbi:MAG: Crp/Fnr family transcriptional regulator [Winogradskyella sp.]|uniref:Crp/Fnr family transcriptional regulator n=1 Tax=Winogradskyella sp. TaxID=1883156 RepID=UPI000F3BC7BE|nr:Crp/Fnr family transcriptional regulator [Winogradskyella sp.]RNC80200.1 MAG: Crp/Fnr family transcriptional regulator [Winogradskyella sp.]
MTEEEIYSKLKSRFTSEITVSDNLWSDIKSIIEIKTIKKNEILIPYDSLDPNVYPIIKGSFMCSLVTEEGNKKAVWFFFDDEFDVACAHDSFFLNKRTKYEIVALEESIVARTGKADFENLLDKHQEFNTFFIKDILNKFIKLNEVRSHSLVYNSEDYIRYLKKEYPIIFSRIPAKHIAHFLGVTPEWYSKLLKKDRVLN